MNRPSLAAARILFSGCVFLAAPCWGTSFRVAPVTVQLSGKENVSTLTLFNDGSTPVPIQIRPFAWTQGLTGETLKRTTGLLASPPSLTLQPGAQYVVRILRDPKLPAARKEESYRLLIDELPQPAPIGESEVRLTLRQSLPVFFSTDARAVPEVAWRLIKDEGGLELIGSNSGGRRVRLSGLELKDHAGAVLLRREGLVGYVLAGSQMKWSLGLSAEAAARATTLSAQSDAGPINVSITLDK